MGFRKRWRVSAGLVRIAGLTTASVTALAGASVQAQTVPPAPVRAAVDANGVDLFSGALHVDVPSMSLGDGSNGLEFHRWNKGSGWSDSYTGFLYLLGSTMTAAIGETSDTFTVSGSAYIPTEGNGASLVLDTASNLFTYTAHDGTVTHFSRGKVNGWTSSYGNQGLISDITRPNGEKVVYSYQSIDYCSQISPTEPDVCRRVSKAYRISDITNNYGYRLVPAYDPAYDYTYDPYSPQVQPNFVAWSNIVGMNARNLASSLTTNLAAQSYGTVTNGGTTSYVVTDAAARQTSYRMASGLVSGVTRPGSGSEDVTIGYNAGRVSSVTVAGLTTSYNASDAGNVRTVTVTAPGPSTTVYTFDIPSKRMTSVKDPVNFTTAMTYDGSGRLTRTTYPEGNYVNLTYDARGNVTEQRQVSKTPGTPADIVVSASYAASCTNTATCNQPVWTRDALGNQTDYTYDATHGGVLSVTSPAATSGAVRPQARYSYSSLQAYYLNASGSVVASGQPVTRLTGTSTCLTTASCTGTADEAKTAVSYGPQSAGTPNNLLPLSVTRAAGDNSVSAVTTVSYDAVGNATAVDGPLPGSGDTAVTRYDVLRRPVGTIAPDPDGAGGRINAATRTTYDTQGRVVLTEQGTTNGQSDTAWAGFTPEASVATTYDGADRKLTETLKNGATAYGLTQYSYDGAGRLDCTAVRMNPAAYGALPASACQFGTTGPDGPDRMTRVTYDAANRPITSTTAYGTPESATETVSYTANGKAASVRDGENNLTIAEYDGHDRPVKTRYPVPAKGSNAASTSDYTELTYNANSQVTYVRQRDGSTLGFSRDNLGRVTHRGGSTVRDLDYAYNLLGQLTYAAGGSGWGAETLSYNALGRLTQRTQPYETLSYQYDAAGNRTRLTWGDGLFIQYDYDQTGLVTAIRENGAGSGVGVLASYGYDNLGRRSAIAYGNGTARYHAYDAVGRLYAMTNDLSGTANDISLEFHYIPSGQLSSVTRSNDAYAWAGHYNADRSYGSNGLNQLTSAGATALGYDGRGNLTSSGSTTYGYDGVNHLTTSNASGAAGYIEYGVLDELMGVGAALRFASDGGNIIGEYDISSGSKATISRYVYAPGTDEPIVWYESNSTANRRWLSADERGSIIAVSDAAGNTLAINRYDEYGIPQSGNVGRFQYTGQAWVPELGLYYYKARMYSPTLGRFMQTDPIGYADGLNWYNYVGSDPVNATDPSGLYQVCFPAAYYKNFEGVQPSFRQACVEVGDNGRSGRGDLGEINRGSGGDGIVVTANAKKPVKAPPVASQSACGVGSKGANTPQGKTVGNNPTPYNGSGPLNTNLPGGYTEAVKLFAELTAAIDFGNYMTFPPQGLITKTKVGTIVRGNFSGIALRIGKDGKLRIDIPANKLDLKVPEDIHFTGEKKSDC